MRVGFVAYVFLMLSGIFGEQIESGFTGIWQANGKFYKVKYYLTSGYEKRMIGLYRYESLDGYTIIQDAVTGKYCYAYLDKRGEKLLSSGITYQGDELLNNTIVIESSGETITLEKSLALRSISNESYSISSYDTNNESVSEEGFDNSENDEDMSTLLNAKTSASSNAEEIKMITILVDFPDVEFENKNEMLLEVDAALNQKENYTTNGHLGSVYEYWKDVSNGKINFSSDVVYYRAKKNKSHYAQGSFGGKYSKELVIEAIEGIDGNYDYKKLTDSEKGINVFCAGRYTHGNGMHPHKSNLVYANLLDGQKIKSYQLTSIGSFNTSGPEGTKVEDIRMGTFIHELGHLLFGWPDLYSSGSKVIGFYGIMCLGNHLHGGKKPSPPNPYLRVEQGWEKPYFLSGFDKGDQFSTPDHKKLYVYENKEKTSEMFYIESSYKSKWYSGLSSNGLFVWHYDAAGNRHGAAMTAQDHYIISLEQADGNFNLEQDPWERDANGTIIKDANGKDKSNLMSNNGDNGDLFPFSENNNIHPYGNNSFHKNSTPSAKWWDESNSGLKLLNITRNQADGYSSFQFGNALTIQDGLGYSGDVNFHGAKEWEAGKDYNKKLWFSESGDIGHNQLSVFSIEEKGPLFIQFDWKVSSENEEGCSHDRLTFWVNNTEQKRICGERDWHSITKIVSETGTNRLIWAYHKNESIVGGEDKGYVKNLNIVPLGAILVPVNSLLL